MMPRRTFLGRTLLGAARLALFPSANAPARPSSLWIADRESSVAFTVQLLAQHCGFADARVFACKQHAIKSLRTVAAKPTLLVTDYWSGNIQGDEFIRLARHASPGTKLIVFSAVVGSLERWIAVAGASALRPDAIAEKPNARKLMTTLCQPP